MGLFAEKITEEQFFSDLQKAKICVDNGIEDWFIYAWPSAVIGVQTPKNTLLKDLVEVFGMSYVTFFRFAGFLNCGNNGATKDEYQSIQIRPLTNSDKKKLSSDIRFFPKDTWVCDWRGGDGIGQLWPFIQDEETGEIEWLFLDPLYRKSGFRTASDWTCMPVMCVPDMLNIMPDYWDMQLAKVRYKGTDILIPIAGDTAKYTFKNRNRDEFGVKRHVIHSVKAHKRKNADDEVMRHLRGTSEITIHGEQIVIMAAISFSEEYALRKLEKKKPRHNKRKKK